MLRDLRLAAFVGGGLPQYTVDIVFVLIVDYPPGCSVHTLAGKARPRTEGWSVSSHLIVLRLQPVSPAVTAAYQIDYVRSHRAGRVQ